MDSSESPENSETDEDVEFLYRKASQELESANEAVKKLEEENAFLQSKLYS